MADLLRISLGTLILFVAGTFLLSCWRTRLPPRRWDDFDEGE